MSRLPLCIFSEAKDLQDGLFGNVFYHTYQILPYLYDSKILPAWEIRASQYGSAPDFVTIPGSLDLAYTPPQGPYRKISLSELRRQQGKILGNDWSKLNRIWNTYFKIPPRVLDRADAVEAFRAGRALGVHYRGNDKLTTLDDSNPVTQETYLTLVRDFLAQRSDFDFIFAATDEFSFVQKLRSSINLPVVNLGEVEFHKAKLQTIPPSEKTDRAILDCVLLSRCHCVIETSSALPSFAKVFNPDLEIYRCAASKLFADVPYFPVAYIPPLPVKNPESLAILRASMEGDWTYDTRMDKYKRPFTARRRKPLRQAALIVAYSLGARTVIETLVDASNRRIRAKLSQSTQG